MAGFLAFADGWKGLGLEFSFADGTFSYAQSVAQFRPEWDRPTPLNKQRVVKPDGSLGPEADDGD